MHRAILPTSVLFLALGLSGCVHPKARPMPQSQGPAQTASTPAPTATPSQAVAMPTEDDGVPFYDLTGAYGLTVALDLVTGRRVCRDGVNEVVVMPSAKRLIINNVVHPLGESIRWRNGVLYLPSECRSLLAQHLSLVPIPDVSTDPELFDGSEVHLSRWEPSKAPKAVARHAQRAESLPSAWRVDSSRPWRYIVIHHSATKNGGAKSFHREHSKKWKNGLGYHFVIGNGSSTPDGQIEVGTRWTAQTKGVDGAHAGNKRYNKFGVGICLVGDFSGSGPTAAQLVSLRRLCRALMRRYQIPAGRIFPHRDVRRGHTDCPGTEFPFSAFIRSL